MNVAPKKTAPCKWCGVADEWHDREQLARYCHPEQVKFLEAVRQAASALVAECDGGRQSPSLGALARLESALSAAWWGNVKSAGIYPKERRTDSPPGCSLVALAGTQETKT